MTEPSGTRILRSLERIAVALERIADVLSTSPAEEQPVEQATEHVSALAPATTPPNVGAADAERTARQDSRVLERFLVSRGIALKRVPPEREYDEALDRIAGFIGDRYDALRLVYDAIRGSMNSARGLRLSLRNASQREVADICQLCTQLHEIAFLEEYKYLRAPRMELFAKPSRNPRALNFFAGQWLERYANRQVVLACEAQHRNYDRIVNPQVVLPNGDDFEFDLLFAIAGDVYWFEAKTGDYQRYVEKYSRIAKLLGLEGSRAFLILTDVSDETARDLRGLFGMTVVSTARFRPELERVLMAACSA
jgi:hypothetical protein